MARPPSDKEQVTIRLERRTLELVKGLDPMYGSTEAEKIRQIVTLWLHDNSTQVKR
jgi:hypothetical protein